MKISEVCQEYNKILCYRLKSIQRFAVKIQPPMLHLSKFIAKISKPLRNLPNRRFSAGPVAPHLPLQRAEMPVRKRSPIAAPGPLRQGRQNVTVQEIRPASVHQKPVRPPRAVRGPSLRRRSETHRPRSVLLPHLSPGRSCCISSTARGCIMSQRISLESPRVSLRPNGTISIISSLSSSSSRNDATQPQLCLILFASGIETRSPVAMSFGKQHAAKRKDGRMLNRSAAKDHQARDLGPHIYDRTAIFLVVVGQERSRRPPAVRGPAVRHRSRPVSQPLPDFAGPHSGS